MKIVSLNCENLFISLPLKFQTDDIDSLDEEKWAQLGRGPQRNKNLKHTLRLAAQLLDINAEVICLSEVGGQESLDHFLSFFLNGKYRGTYFPGNSDRGIGLAVLIRNDSEFKLHFETNTALTIPPSVYRFARDLPELYFHNSQNELLFILLPVHLKSKRDPWGLDPHGNEQRRAEVEMLIQIYQRLQIKHSVPIAICGDFNGKIFQESADQEFEALFTQTNLLELNHLLGLPEAESWSFFSRSSSIPVVGLAIDSFLLSPEWLPVIDKTKSGIGKYYPTLSKVDLLNIPSDHCPVILTTNGFI